MPSANEIFVELVFIIDMDFCADVTCSPCFPFNLFVFRPLVWDAYATLTLSHFAMKSIQCLQFIFLNP